VFAWWQSNIHRQVDAFNSPREEGIRDSRGVFAVPKSATQIQQDKATGLQVEGKQVGQRGVIAADIERGKEGRLVYNRVHRINNP